MSRYNFWGVESIHDMSYSGLAFKHNLNVVADPPKANIESGSLHVALLEIRDHIRGVVSPLLMSASLPIEFSRSFRVA